MNASTGTLRRLGRELYRYIRSRIPQTADAEDILADVWLAAGRLFEGRAPLRRFVFVVARRRIGEYWRRFRERPGLATASIDDPSELFDAELGDDEDLERRLVRTYGFKAIERALPTISDNYRSVLLLRLAGFSNAEVADELGLDYHTVRSRGSRGKRGLLDALEQSER